MKGYTQSFKGRKFQTNLRWSMTFSGLNHVLFINQSKENVHNMERSAFHRLISFHCQLSIWLLLGCRHSTHACMDATMLMTNYNTE